MGFAGLLDVLQSLRFYARRLAADHPGDVDLVRAVDALAEQIDALVGTLTSGGYCAHRSLTFRVSPREHPVALTTSGSDRQLVIDDASGANTLALAAASYSHIAAALRAWADRAEAADTVF